MSIRSAHCVHSSLFRLRPIKCVFTCWLNKATHTHTRNSRKFIQSRNVYVLLKHVPERSFSVFVRGWPVATHTIHIHQSFPFSMKNHYWSIDLNMSDRNLDVNGASKKQQHKQPAYVNGCKSSTCVYACVRHTCAARQNAIFCMHHMKPINNIFDLCSHDFFGFCIL